MAISNRDRLMGLIGQVLDLKEDKKEILSGFLGTVIRGRQYVKVPNRNGFVFVRLNGNDSELIHAFNDKVPNTYGLKVLLAPSPDGANYYVIIGKDASTYQSWPSTDPYLPKHAITHSMGQGVGAGTDPVFLYKKQLLQPMGVRPTSSTGSSYVYVEGDFYQWNGVNKRFPGGTSIDLTTFLPTGLNGRFVVVALDGNTNSLVYFTGVTFSFFPFPPTGTLRFIPDVDTETAIPLAAIYLASGTSNITFDEIYDLRNFLNEGGLSAASVYNYTTGAVEVGLNGGSFVGPRKKLNFIEGTNVTIGVADNPGLSAVDITIDSSGGSSSTAGHIHGLARFNVLSGTSELLLPDFAEYIDNIFYNGFLYDPFNYTLTGSKKILFSSPLTINGTIVANYVIQQV